MKAKLMRGFKLMDRQRRKEIASLGGKAAHAKGSAHQLTTEMAREAGRKGGRTVSANIAYMAEIGRRGGQQKSRLERLTDAERALFNAVAASGVFVCAPDGAIIMGPCVESIAVEGSGMRNRCDVKQLFTLDLVTEREPTHPWIPKGLLCLRLTRRGSLTGKKATAPPSIVVTS